MVVGSAAIASVQDFIKGNKKEVAVAAGVTTAVLLAGLAYRRACRNYVPKSGPYPTSTLPADAYDAVIVGAGPSGSVCGYYFAKGGAKVALLDKETFPRDKVPFLHLRSKNSHVRPYAYVGKA